MLPFPCSYIHVADIVALVPNNCLIDNVTLCDPHLQCHSLNSSSLAKALVFLQEDRPTCGTHTCTVTHFRPTSQYIYHINIQYHIIISLHFALASAHQRACTGTQIMVQICANQDSMLRLSRPQKCKLLRNGVSLDLSRPISLSCRTVCGRPWHLLAAQKDVGTCSLQASSVSTVNVIVYD